MVYGGSILLIRPYDVKIYVWSMCGVQGASDVIVQAMQRKREEEQRRQAEARRLKEVRL